jgi:RHS repeat-associated protein
MVAIQSGERYLAYAIDSDRAWLVVRLGPGGVAAVMVAARGREQTTYRDAASGVSLGLPRTRVWALLPRAVAQGTALYDGPAGRERRFYGFANDRTVDRIGVTREDATLPAVIRWYERTGPTLERAVEPSTYGGTQAGEDAYVAHLDTLAVPFQCLGNRHWTVVGHRDISAGGAHFDAARIRCGAGGTQRTLYFATSSRPVTPEDLAQQPAAAASVVRGTTATPAPQIWALNGPGTRYLENLTTGTIDYGLFSYTFAQSDPPTAISIVNNPEPTQTTDTLGRSVESFEPDAAQTASPCSMNNGSGSGTGKCPDPPDDTGDGSGSGPPTLHFGIPKGPHGPGGSRGCYGIVMHLTSGKLVKSKLTCMYTAKDPRYFEHHKRKCAAGGGAGGDPVDIPSGDLLYANDDFELAQPFGLALSRHYDSGRANNADGGIGYGWSFTYGAYLDLTFASQHSVAYYDGGCNWAYFGSVWPGVQSYDDESGSTLVEHSNGTFVIHEFDGSTSEFDKNGQLTLLRDRIGNTQTVKRAGSEAITSVTDSLGRVLEFATDQYRRVTKITSGAGVKVTLTYDSGNNCYFGDLCSVTESDGAKWTYNYYNPASYGGFHLLQSVVNPLGTIDQSAVYDVVNFSANDDHFRVIHEERQGESDALQFSWLNESNTTVTPTLDNYRITTYGVNPDLQEVTYVSGYLCQCDGNAYSYQLDGFGRVTAVGDDTGKNITATYGRDSVFTSPGATVSYIDKAYPGPTGLTFASVSTTTGGQTRSETFGYYPIGDPRQDLIDSIVSPSVDTPGRSVTTTRSFSAAGLLTAVSRAGYVNGNPTTQVSSFTYDSRGRLLSATGPRVPAATTKYAYYSDSDADENRRGQLASVQDALGHATSFAKAPKPFDTYDTYGDPASVTDPNGVSITFAYDAAGRLSKRTLLATPGEPTNLTTSYAYDALGLPTAVTQPEGNGVAYAYDVTNVPTAKTLFDSTGLQHDRISTVNDNLSEVATLSYQSCPTPAKACANWATKRSENFTYNGSGLIGSLAFPAGGGYQATYDYNTGPLENTFSFGDSTFGVLRYYNEDSVGLTAYSYSGGRASSNYYHDLDGNISLDNTVGELYSYDDFGNLIKRTSGLDGTWTFGYDADGNVTKQIDGNGATTTTTYDALDRPLKSVSSRTGTPNETVTWTYDGGGAGNFGIGRLQKMTDPSGSTAYIYERRGLVAKRTQTIGTKAFATSYQYDGNGNAAQVTMPSGRVLTYAYDWADRPRSVSSGATTYVSLATYLPFGPLSVVQYGNGTVAARSYDSRYWPAGLRVTKGSQSLVSLVYTTDNAGFVTSITDKLDPNYDQTMTLGVQSPGVTDDILASVTTGPSLYGSATFGEASYRNLATITLGTAYALSFGYDNAYSVTSVYNGGTKNPGSVAVTVDTDGNESSVGSSSYAYSARDLLASGDGITYSYDGFGRRVKASGHEGTRLSIYDDDLRLESESATSGDAIGDDYIYLGAEPVAQEDVGGATHWTVTDLRGAAFLQTGSSGGVFWQADYYPYGSIYALRTPDAHQPLRQPGQEAEEFSTSDGPNGATGRFYNGMRWYRPLWGRYTQPDPIINLTNPMSRYAYGLDEPLAYGDRYGLFPGYDDAAAFATGSAVDAVDAFDGPALGSHGFDAVPTAVRGMVGEIMSTRLHPSEERRFASYARGRPRTTHEKRRTLKHACAIAGRTFASFSLATELAGRTARSVELGGNEAGRFAWDGVLDAAFQALGDGDEHPLTLASHMAVLGSQMYDGYTDLGADALGDGLDDVFNVYITSSDPQSWLVYPGGDELGITPGTSYF